MKIVMSCRPLKASDCLLPINHFSVQIHRNVNIDFTEVYKASHQSHHWATVLHLGPPFCSSLAIFRDGTASRAQPTSVFTASPCDSLGLMVLSSPDSGIFLMKWDSLPASGLSLFMLHQPQLCPNSSLLHPSLLSLSPSPVPDSLPGVLLLLPSKCLE